MNTITGYTGLYGIVANPIKHSFSPDDAQYGFSIFRY